MSLDPGTVVQIAQSYRLWGDPPDMHCDAHGKRTTYGVILGPAADNAAFFAATVATQPTGESVWNTTAFDGVTRVYFDSNGDGTGTSAPMWNVRAKLIDGGQIEAVYPEHDLTTGFLRPDVTITTDRG